MSEGRAPEAHSCPRSNSADACHGERTGDLLIGNIKRISFCARLEWDALITDFLVDLVQRLAIVKSLTKLQFGILLPLLLIMSCRTPDALQVPRLPSGLEH
jgi:hypothetical protein